MMSLSSAIEPLRSLNRLVQHEAYRWRLASLDGGPVCASNGIPFPTVPADDALADGPDRLRVAGHVDLVTLAGAVTHRLRSLPVAPLALR